MPGLDTQNLSRSTTRFPRRVVLFPTLIGGPVIRVEALLVLPITPIKKIVTCTGDPACGKYLKASALRMMNMTFRPMRYRYVRYLKTRSGGEKSLFPHPLRMSAMRSLRHVEVVSLNVTLKRDTNHSSVCGYASTLHRCPHVARVVDRFHHTLPTPPTNASTIEYHHIGRIAWLQMEGRRLQSNHCFRPVRYTFLNTFQRMP